MLACVWGGGIALVPLYVVMNEYDSQVIGMRKQAADILDHSCPFCFVVGL